MISHIQITLIILVTIIATGLVAIPFGNPNFVDRAIILELSFVTLFVLIWKGYNKALYACIPLAAFVIIGNSLAPPHVNTMMTFSNPLNAIVLIVGGYILQIALVIASLLSILNMRSRRITSLN
ncbi:hypothetical protein [Candidatus Nitrosocosmicus franklandus]|uniref:hypothetical protein n=1 Tax=Candidatus Nitrosocosmicus franklandianus TaxID=1798806 RepID=UPI0015590670|nr:hypothetical protein [Candidatus Nitrosocosmicus franklandus]